MVPAGDQRAAWQLHDRANPMGSLRRDRGRRGSRSIVRGQPTTAGWQALDWPWPPLDTIRPSVTAFLNRLLSLVVFLRHAGPVAVVTISRTTTHVTFWI